MVGREDFVPGNPSVKDLDNLSALCFAVIIVDKPATERASWLWQILP
jgi:hypothetical protein